MFDQLFKKEIKATVCEAIGEYIDAVRLPRLMRIDQAVVYLGQKSETALRQRLASGQIPEWVTVRIGGSIYFDRVRLDQWLSSLSDAA